MSEIIVTFVLAKRDVLRLRELTPSLTMSSTVESVAALTDDEAEAIVRQHVEALRARSRTQVAAE